MTFKNPLRKLVALLSRGSGQKTRRRSSRLGRDERGVATGVALPIVLAFLVVSAGVVHVVATDKVKQEADMGSVIEKSGVTVLDQDKVRVVPLIGSTLDPAKTTVRVSFPDSDKQGFEIHNIGAAARQSSTTSVTNVKFVKAGTKEVPVYKNVKTNYYELREERKQVGTQTEVRSTPIYVWKKTEIDYTPIYTWKKTYTTTKSKVSRHSPGSGYDKGIQVGTQRVQTGYTKEKVFSHYSYSREKVRDGYSWEKYRAGSYPSVKKVFTGYKRVVDWEWSWSRGLYKTYDWKKQYRYKTVWKPIYSWKLVSNWKWVTDKDPVYKTVRNPTYTTYPEYRWTKTIEHTTTKVSKNKPGSGFDRAGIHHYETKKTTQTKTSTSSPGGEWTRGDRAGNHYYTVQKPVYKTVTKKVLVDSKTERVIDHYKKVPDYRMVTSSTEEMEFSDEVQRLGDDDERGPGATAGLARASVVSAGTGLPFLSFFGGKGKKNMPAHASEVVSGVGGTMGTTSPTAWGNGESFTIDLAKDVIAEGDLVRVQVIDTEDGKLVIDRTVRAENLPTEQFGTKSPVANPPSGGDTTTTVRNIVENPAESDPRNWVGSGHTSSSGGYTGSTSTTTETSDGSGTGGPATTTSTLIGGGPVEDTEPQDNTTIPPEPEEPEKEPPIEIHPPVQRKDSQWSVRAPHSVVRIDYGDKRLEMEMGSWKNPVTITEDDGSSPGYALGRLHDLYDWSNEHGVSLDNIPGVAGLVDHAANKDSKGSFTNSVLDGAEWLSEGVTGENIYLHNNRYTGPDSHGKAERKSHTKDLTFDKVLNVVKDSGRKYVTDNIDYGDANWDAIKSGRMTIVDNGEGTVTDQPTAFTANKDNKKQKKTSRRSSTSRSTSHTKSEPKTEKTSVVDRFTRGVGKLADELPGVGNSKKEQQSKKQSKPKKQKKSIAKKAMDEGEKLINKGKKLLKDLSPW